jgi:hypothetical protein
MPLDADGGVEPGAVVLPGDDSRHLDDGRLRKMLHQTSDERLVDGRRRGGHPLGVLQGQVFLDTEFASIPPGTGADGGDSVVTDPVGAAPGSVEILSQRAANDRTGTQIEQARDPGRDIA